MVDNPRLRNTRSKDFRYVYANGLGAQYGGNEFILIFGIKEDTSPTDGKIMEEVGVVMTANTVKNLAISLTKMIEHLELTTGTKIPVEQDKLDIIEKTLKEAAATAEKLKLSPTS
jgi:hypothetical protein